MSANGENSGWIAGASLRDRLELWSAVLLAAATLTTAYSAYEATRWSGRQSTRYAQAGATRTKATKEDSRGYSLVSIDANLFAQIAEAYFRDEEELVDFLRPRLRSEFVPAFNEWLAEKPLKDPRAKPTPFQEPSYKPKAIVESDRLDRKADGLFEEGREANQTGDNYVLATIFFAAVLFFAGLSVKFRSQRLIIATLIFGSAMFVAGVVRLATLPFL